MGGRAGRLGIVLLVGVGLLSLASCVADAPPGDPTAVAGNGQVTVSWTTPIGDTGALVTKYKVTPHIGSEAQAPIVFNSTATTQTVTGLVNGTSYRFMVHAINGLGYESGGSYLSNPVTPTATPVGLTAGSAHACALIGDGSAHCWGGNFDGLFGADSTEFYTSPVPVSGLTDATVLSGGDRHTCAVIDDGTAECWGNNFDGQLGSRVGFSGSGENQGTSIPQTVIGLTNVTAIAAGPKHTCAVLADGTARCWGRRGFGGALGDGVGCCSTYTPVTVTGLSGATAIATGAEHSCALLNDGTVRCWGQGFYGQLGNGGTADSSTPVPVSGITTAVTIDAQNNHTCAGLADGTVRCWGQNSYGQLGNGTTTNSSTPVAVSGLTNAATITTGFLQSCALLHDGTARCWGRNDLGQLGNGTTAHSQVPVVVTDLTNAIAIDGGASHACALLSDDTVRCWGYGASGQLGDGTSGAGHFSTTPVTVLGLA